MPSLSPSAFPGSLLFLLALGVSACDREVVFIEPEIAASESSVFVDIGEEVVLDVATVPEEAAFDAYSEDEGTATVQIAVRDIVITGVNVGFTNVILTLRDHSAPQFLIVVEVLCPPVDECDVGAS